MENKKSFYKGCLCGIVFVIALNFLVTNSSLLFRRVVTKNLTLEQKMEEIQNIVDTYSVNEFDPKLVNEGMLSGMVATLNDPYSYYMPKNNYEKFLEDTQGNYVGIGIMISVTKQGEMIISKVFDNSPAKEVGLLEEDKILKVEDEDVTIDNYETIVSKIKGKEGTKVNLTLFRPSKNETIQVDVLRKSIDVPTVEYKMLEDNIGYISISQFDKITEEQFKNAYNEIEKLNSKGLIIDLRNNPGGLLNVVCNITDLLVPEGIITYIEDKNGNKQYQYSDTDYYNKPLVILVNGNSASASEVLSGAVKDYGVASLVGEKTYGKGVVQSPFTLSDGSGVKVTIAKYYTPKGICIDKTGIEPDYYVENDPESDIDLQLQKGIEVIKEKINNEIIG